MKNPEMTEKEIWCEVKKLMGDKLIKFGKHWSFNVYNDPKRLAFVLSRYKFAAKMASANKDVLELGCSEGIGAQILSEFASSYTGVDLDPEAVRAAKRNWGSKRVRFVCDDFLGKRYGRFDTVVSLDVVGLIKPKGEKLFFKTVFDNLDDNGIAIIGTPNMSSRDYASKASRKALVNFFSAQRLRAAMERLFKTVFIFGLNDEIVHTGFLPMAHYIICIGCFKKKKVSK